MWCEQIATVCNLSANASMLRRMYTDPTRPVPSSVLMLQCTANIGWILFAYSNEDIYLLSTAMSSLIMQATSLILLTSNTNKKIIIDSPVSLPGTE